MGWLVGWTANNLERQPKNSQLSPMTKQVEIIDKLDLSYLPLVPNGKSEERDIRWKATDNAGMDRSNLNAGVLKILSHIESDYRDAISDGAVMQQSLSSLFSSIQNS